MTGKLGRKGLLFTCLLIETMSVEEKNKKDGGHRGMTHDIFFKKERYQGSDG